MTTNTVHWKVTCRLPITNSQKNKLCPNETRFSSLDANQGVQADFTAIIYSNFSRLHKRRNF